MTTSARLSMIRFDRQVAIVTGGGRGLCFWRARAAACDRLAVPAWKFHGRVHAAGRECFPRSGAKLDWVESA